MLWLIFLLASMPIACGKPENKNTQTKIINYYVHSTAGNDNNAGTEKQPLRTISEALKRVQPGERIGIYSGTYRETLAFQQSGIDSNKTISLEALPGEEVWIKGSDIIANWVLHSGWIWKRAGWRVNTQQVFVDGVPLQQIGTNSPFHTQYFEGNPILPSKGNRFDDMVPNSFWFDPPNQTLYIRLNNDSSPEGHVIEASVRDWIIPYYENLNYVELHGLHFSHSNQTATGFNMGIVNVAGRSWLVEGNTFTNGDFSGISIFGEGHLIRNNVSNNNGSVGITINGSDTAHNFAPYPDRPPQYILLDGNETNSNNYRKFNRSWIAGGIKAATSCNAIDVSRHNASFNNGPGIWVDIFSIRFTIDQCNVTGNDGAGILYEISDSANITNNFVSENSKQGIYVSASSEVNVIGNTLVRNWAGIAIHGMPRPEHPTLRNNTVSTNIFRGNTFVDLVLYDSPPSTAGNISDFNKYYSSNGNIAISWTSTPDYDVNYTNLSSFSNETGNDLHSVVLIGP